MVAQMTGNFFHRHVVEACVIEDSARRLRARHARLDGHLAVFAVSVRQFHLRPDADEQTRQREQKIQWIKSVKHKLVSIDSTSAVFIQRNTSPLLE